MKLLLVEGCRAHVRHFAVHAGQLEAGFMLDRGWHAHCLLGLAAALF